MKSRNLLTPIEVHHRQNLYNWLSLVWNVMWTLRLQSQGQKMRSQDSLIRRDTQEIWGEKSFILLQSNLPWLQHLCTFSGNCTEKSLKVPKGTFFSLVDMLFFMILFWTLLQWGKFSYWGIEELVWGQVTNMVANLHHAAMRSSKAVTVLHLLISETVWINYMQLTAFPKYS